MRQPLLLLHFDAFCINLFNMMDDNSSSSTSVFVGNLRKAGRIGELKTHLLALFLKVLKIHISQSDISIINGAKKYAIVDVHHQQNVDNALESLTEYHERRKLKFDFLTLVEKGVMLYVDRLKSRDDRQARDDFENAKNSKPFGYQVAHRPRRPITRQNINQSTGRVNSFKSTSSRSVVPKSSVTGRSMSRSSLNTTRGDNHLMSRSSVHYPLTDLDVTIDELLTSDGETDRKPRSKVHVVPVPPRKEESDDSGRQSENSERQLETPELGAVEEDSLDEEEEERYEDPPGSVIDLRNVQRSSMKMKKIGPRVKRTPMYDIPAKTSTSREDFFSFLDNKIGMSKAAAPQKRVNTITPRSILNESHSKTTHKGMEVENEDEEEEEEGYAFFKLGERLFNYDGKKEFKAVSGGNQLRIMREHVGKCVCGFLNSREPGFLLIGVDTDGTVIGVECDPQQEERYERHLVETMKEIYPPIYTEDYSISFLPIIENNGRQHPDLKVIEIRTQVPEDIGLLFECKEGVFVRRNNIMTGPIKPSHIQEWIKVKHFGEVADLRKQEALMREALDKKDLMVRKQADTINSQRSEIENQERLLNSRHCVIL